MGWIPTLLASGVARKAMGLMLAALTIILFLLNLRPVGERARRLAGRLQASETPHAILDPSGTRVDTGLLD